MMYCKHVILLFLSSKAWSFTTTYNNNNAIFTSLSQKKNNAVAFGIMPKQPLYMSEAATTATTEEASSDSSETSDDMTEIPGTAEAVTNDVAADDDADAAVASEEEDVKEEVKEEEGFKIFIGNLPTTMDETSIRSLFEPHGTVTELKVPIDRFSGSPRGFAFIVMSSEEEGNKAIEALNETEIEGRIIRCNIQLPKDKIPKKKRSDRIVGTKLYVGNLSFETTQESLVEYFGQYGPVTDCFLPTDRETGYKRGFGFITMSDADALQAIEHLDGLEFEGRNVQVNKSLPKGQSPPRQKRTRPRDITKLYIGNLPYDTSQDEIYSLFEEYGDIQDCYVPLDRETGQARGFAFVSMKKEDAERAIDETDGFEFDGRILRVNEAEPKRPSRRSGWEEEGGGDIWENNSNEEGY